ncbi:hypothetical protein DOTSEDRAFT_73625 [Dothistroma septosporum NZE10]|uniref:Uncharacterized protein n=1 Tax=Dothistroma septosporum (strain NZE10 / CBS 128990) TaxID=675120 RepID=N1PGM8_DOTSN|nr:hypothetical protein DOTSEDRAFT_73625 [Dothistroma septosporum NZE10]
MPHFPSTLSARSVTVQLQLHFYGSITTPKVRGALGSTQLFTSWIVFGSFAAQFSVSSATVKLLFRPRNPLDEPRGLNYGFLRRAHRLKRTRFATVLDHEALYVVGRSVYDKQPSSVLFAGMAQTSSSAGRDRCSYDESPPIFAFRKLQSTQLYFIRTLAAQVALLQLSVSVRGSNAS